MFDRTSVFFLATHFITLLVLNVEVEMLSYIMLVYIGCLSILTCVLNHKVSDEIDESIDISEDEDEDIVF